MQEQLEAAKTKIASLEKARHHSQQEMEDAQKESERANALVMTALEEKQSEMDKLAEEWKGKCDALVGFWLIFRINY